MSSKSPWQQARKTWQQAWAQRSPREQTLLLAAAVLFLCVALWHWALAPALQTWQEAPARQSTLDNQTHNMRALQAQAKTLQKPSSVSRTEATQWLEKSLSGLGPNAKISLQGDNATLRVEAAPATAMANWMRQARESAQTLPLQAQMQQVTSPSGNEVLWQGSLVLRLP